MDVLDDGEDVILFDSGSRAPEHFNIVKEKVCSLVEPERINYCQVYSIIKVCSFIQYWKNVQ